MKRMFQEWREVAAFRDARILLIAGALSLAGDAMAMVALVLRVHASGAGPYAVSGLLWCFALPVVVTMGLAGRASDRIDSRRLLVASGLVQALAAAALSLVDDLWATFASVLVLQTAFAFGNPVWTTLLPRVVGERLVGRLIALQQGLRAAAGPAGAGLGGVLVQWRGDGIVFALDAVSFLVLVCAAMALRIRRRGEDPDVSPTGRRRVLRSLLPTDGVAALRSARVLWVLVLALLPFIVTVESVNVVEVFLVRDVLGAGPAQYGLGEVVAGSAAIVGSFVAGSILHEQTRVRAIVWALFGCAAAQVGQGLAPSFPWYLLGAAAVGFLLAIGNACIFALLVTGIPDAHRGRVLTLVNGLSRACTALALLLGGVLATTVGARAAYVIVGVAGLAVAIGAATALRRVSVRRDLANPALVDLPAAGQAH
ncbi:MAG: MFS transporter [Tetrasphaera sp.]|nr:MFS transporter [Tetrasphaera sp.]